MTATGLKKLSEVSAASFTRSPSEPQKGLRPTGHQGCAIRPWCKCAALPWHWDAISVSNLNFIERSQAPPSPAVLNQAGALSDNFAALARSACCWEGRLLFADSAATILLLRTNACRFRR